MRVLVRGAGIIGLSVADELLQRGHQVEVVDPAPATGASRAAAGMLGPAAEAAWTEPALLPLARRSLALWPAFAARLEVPLLTTGTLLVGHDAADLQQVRRQGELLAASGVVVEELRATAVRARAPMLARTAGGVWLPDDHAVDPRAVTSALLRRVRPRTRTSRRSPEIEVIATGARLPAPWNGLVRGVRGEILRVRTDDPPPVVVRGWVAGEPIYLVPRREVTRAGDCDLVIGATSEEHDAAPIVTVGGVGRLLDAARTLLPGLERAEFVEALARDRPTARDHLPLIGPAPDRPASPPLPTVLLAAGHHRHGVLLAPLTAQLIADLLDGGAVESALDPRRFTSLIPQGATDAPDHAQR